MHFNIRNNNNMQKFYKGITIVSHTSIVTDAVSLGAVSVLLMMGVKASKGDITESLHNTHSQQLLVK